MIVLNKTVVLFHIIRTRAVLLEQCMVIAHGYGLNIPQFVKNEFRVFVVDLVECLVEKLLH